MNSEIYMMNSMMKDVNEMLEKYSEKYWTYVYEEDWREKGFRIKKCHSDIIQSVNNKVKIFLKQIKYDTEYTRDKTEVDEVVDEVVDEILDLLLA